MSKASIKRIGNGNDVQDVYSSTTSNSIMSTGMEDATGNYIISSGSSLSEPLMTVQKDGTVVIQNDLIVKGNQTVINSSTINIESPQLDVGLMSSEITFIKQIQNSTYSSIKQYALVSLENQNPDNLILYNSVFSGIYSNGSLSSTYNSSYTPGKVFNSTQVSLIYNTTANQNIQFTAHDPAYVDLTSTTPSLTNSRISLSTTLPLREGAELSEAVSLTSSSTNKILVSSANGFSSSGTLLLRNTTSVGTYVSSSTNTDQYTLQISFTSTAPLAGTYLAGVEDTSGNAYVLGSIESINLVSGTNYRVKFSNIVSLNNNGVYTNNLTSNANIYALIQLNYTGISIIDSTHTEFNGITYSSNLNIPKDTNNGTTRMQVYSLLPVTPGNIYYLGNNPSNNKSSITCNSHDTALSTLPLFDNSPADLNLVLQDYCVWNFDPNQTSNVNLAHVNGKVSFIQPNTSQDGLFNLTWHFTDANNADASKSIMCGTTTEDTLYFTKKNNGTAQTYFTLDYGNNQLSYANGSSIQNKEDGILNIISSSQTALDIPQINLNSQTNGTVNVTGGLNMNSSKFTVDTNGNTVLQGNLTVAGTISAENNAFNVSQSGASTFTGQITSSNSTQSTSTSTGALVVAGGVGIAQNLNIAGTEKITNTTSSTSSSSGALVITGGVGIGENLNVNGNTILTGTEKITNSTSSTSSTSGALVVTGGVGIGENLNVNGNTILAGTEKITNTSSSISSTSGALVITGGVGIGENLNVYGNTILTGTEKIINSTTSNSSTSGALVITGGVGIGENLNVNGNTILAGTEKITNSTSSISTTSGALVINGGVGIGENLNVNGNTILTGTERITNISSSTSSSTGALVVTGGIGIGENLNVNGNTILAGTEKITNSTSSTSSITGALVITGGVGIGQNLNIAGTEKITNTTSSTSSSSGALVITGGVGIGENLNVYGNTILTGIEQITNSTTSTSSTSGALVVTGGLGLGENLNVAGIEKITNSTTSTSSSTGALVITGGVGIGENLNVNGNTILTGTGKITNSTSSTSSITGALVITGGVGIGQNLNIAGTEKITNTTSSTSSSSGALVITGGVGIGENLNVYGNTILTGIEQITNSTSSTSSSSGALVVTGGVGIGENLNVYGNTIFTGTEKITNSTSSTSSSLGALVVTGGVGIGENLNVNGNTTLTGTQTITNTTNVQILNGTITNASLIVDGGVGIAKDLYVHGDTNIIGTLTATTTTTVSDKRLKENIVQLDNSLDKVLSMRGVYFDWIDKERFNDKHQIGFIAQEIEEICPELVITKEDGMKTVNYSQTVSVLVEAIKEQQNIINQLRTDVDQLKNKKPRTYKKKNTVVSSILPENSDD